MLTVLKIEFQKNGSPRTATKLPRPTKSPWPFSRSQSYSDTYERVDEREQPDDARRGGRTARCRSRARPSCRTARALAPGHRPAAVMPSAVFGAVVARRSRGAVGQCACPVLASAMRGAPAERAPRGPRTMRSWLSADELVEQLDRLVPGALGVGARRGRALLSAGPKTFSWMTESSGPLNWATTPSARAARIAPVGASLKNAFGVASAASVSCAFDRAREVAGAADCLTCCSGCGQPVGELGRLLLVLRGLGTDRNAPPQLAAPPGKTSAKSQPVEASPPPASTWPCTTPSIQPGQTKVAKVPSTNDLPPFQSHAVCAADEPALGRGAELLEPLLAARRCPRRSARRRRCSSPRRAG